ncbi:MAG: hypothetical protein ACRCZA_10110 [Shewanella sp.]|uniref:hypothetical protein n=1 Tax=Shewanella sp. TaxID=50422 RepID=UPI003F309CBF
MSASKGELSGTQRREAHCDERHITCSNGTFINRFPQRHANSTLSVQAADDWHNALLASSINISLID